MRKYRMYQLLLIVGVVLDLIFFNSNLYVNIFARTLVFISILLIYFDEGYRKNCYGNISKYIILAVAVFYALFSVRAVQFYLEWQQML